MFQLRWIWKNLDRKHQVLQIICLLIEVTTVFLVLINPWLSGVMMDKVFVDGNIDLLLPILGAMMGVWFVRQGFRYIMHTTMERNGLHLVAKLRNHLFRNLQHQDTSYFDHHRTGDIMTRLSADINWVGHFISTLMQQTLDCIIMFLAVLIYFFTLSWKLTLAIVFVTPVVIAITRLYSSKAHPKFVENRERLSELNTVAQENIAGNRVIKAFVREDYEREKFDRCNDSYRQNNLDINKLWLSFYPYIALMSNAMTIITVFFGAILIIVDPDFTPGTLTIFTSLSWALSNPLNTMGGLIDNFQRFGAAAAKIIELYYERPLITDREDAVDHDTMQGKITFENVTFRYQPDHTVLDNISFEVQAGQTLAILGPTGSGKTTLINLIARFYDPTEGRILVDDCDIHLWKLEQLRSHIGTATQDVFLFSDTVEGNIVFGNQELTPEQARGYAVRAAADGFCSKLPDGYDTIIGERGMGLSGGQKQRLALARAMAVDPAILILDDTTSAVDMETEKHIQEQLRNDPKRRTKIIIAQRISSIKDADLILVLKDGRITERGTHEQLLRLRGYYWETFALQNDIPVDTPVEEGSDD